MYTAGKSDYAFTMTLNRGLALAVRLVDSFTGRTLSGNAFVEIEGASALRKPDGFFVFSQLPEDNRRMKIGAERYREEIIPLEDAHPKVLEFYLHPTPAFVFPKNTAYIAVRNRRLFPNTKYYAAPNGNTGYEYHPRNRAMALFSGSNRVEIFHFAEEMPDVNAGYTSRFLPLSQGRTDESGLLFIPIWGIEDDCREATVYTEGGRKLFTTPVSKSDREGDLLGTCSM